MWRLLALGLVLSTPALAQARKPRPAADPCAPIGQLADRTPVYSLRCDNLPAPPPGQAAAPAEPLVQRNGLFGLSYTRRPAEE
jgi:hypothetical protein